MVFFCIFTVLHFALCCCHPVHLYVIAIGHLASYLVLCLLAGVRQVSRVGLVHAAREHKVLPNQNSELIGNVVEVLRLVNPA